jgi:anti-anti-sigma factor
MLADLPGVTVLEGSASTVVVVRGELDRATLPRLRHVLRAVCAERDDDVGVDLEHVTFCDSQVIGLFAVISARLRRSGRRLVVLGNPPRRSRVFRRHGLEHLDSPV